ncbi:sensor histidine kinase [Bradyrhizobium sp. SK17]|nr:TspO/MBR family protein [Bradyrhizobium sp. SK17]AUC99091.1 sensor histidine kinase [Bradyrhizobium sp. SK17]
MMRYGRLVLFVIAVLGAGFAIGYLNRPGAWYAALSKPAFNPPNWVFAPVWSIVYLLVAVAGWRVREQGSSSGWRLWLTQMALNFAWSPIFFGLHQPGVALAVIAALLLAIVAFQIATWKADRISAILFAPYAVWVAFASLLNFEIVRLN